MQELIIKMALCLIVALAIGFLFGWLLKRALTKSKYEPQIETLQAQLAQSKHHEKTLKLVKDKLLTTQEQLEASNHKAQELDEHITNSQTKLSLLESNLANRESIIKEMQQESELLQTEVAEKEEALKEAVAQSSNNNEMVNRLKEHHALLQEELQKVTQERDRLSTTIATLKANEKKYQDEKIAYEEKISTLQTAVQEKDETNDTLNQLQNTIASYKANEEKMRDEKRAIEGKLAELESALNEKKIAAIELRSKIKEMDALKEQNSMLHDQLTKAQEQNRASLTDISITQQELTSQIEEKKGFDIRKLAQKAFDYIPKSSEEIKRNADRVIEEYKNKKEH